MKFFKSLKENKKGSRNMSFMHEKIVFLTSQRISACCTNI